MSAEKRFWKNDKRTKIKICGFTTLDNAYETAFLGADALGFHVWNKSNVEEMVARFQYIVRFLPDDLSCWLLTDVTEGGLLKQLVSQIGVDTIQFQGKIPVARFVGIIQKLELLRAKKKLRFVKSISMSNGSYDKIMAVIDRYVPYVDAVLLDSRWKGGTGVAHDWALSSAIVRNTSIPVVLAGGLTPENIDQAITTVKPYGVDVESGVERVIGAYRRKKIKCKSIIKIQDFIAKAKYLP